MGMGWMVVSCLLMATGGPADGEVCHVNMRGFTIPVNIDPARQGEVRELVLYLSRDEGRTWESPLRLDPRKLNPNVKGQGFEYQAAGDGMHYFTVAVIDKTGRQEPMDVSKAPVGLKTMIDTVKPVVRLTADRLADEVQVGWEVREDRPNWAKLNLEYKVGTAGSWTPLPITSAGERGGLKFRPAGPGDVTVRLTAEDLAGNVGTDEKTAGGRPDAATLTVSAVGTPAGGPVVTRPETMLAPPAVPGTNAVGAALPPPPATIAGSTPGYDSGAGGSGVSMYPSNDGRLPDVQIVNKPQAKIGFDVAGFGPSGLGVVDVYVTPDEGNNWTPVKLNGGVQMPSGADIKPGVPATGSVAVTLEKEGVIYGVYVVVKSGAGLGQGPPVNGVTKPQMRLEYDATAPSADLHMPQPDVKNKDMMVFTWKADDRNLDANPITLQWAAGPDGPWDFIGEPSLPNTGRYSWRIAPGIPPKVYLKMTVRDRAGNQSEAKTPAPIPLDVSKPITTSLRLLK